MQIAIIDFTKHRGKGMIAYLGGNQSNIQFIILTLAHAKVAKKVIKNLQNWSTPLEVPFFSSSVFPFTMTWHT